MKNKKILILSCVDSKNAGHGQALAEALKSEGYDTFFLSFIKQSHDTKNYIIDLNDKFSLRRILYSLYYNFYNRIVVKPKRLSPYVYKDHHSYTCAEEILRKTPFKPDFIFITLNHNFLSPRDIKRLYDRTHATMVQVMNDDEILGGGCHNVYECLGYTNGCHNCPALYARKSLAEKIYAQKAKYFKDIPMHIVGNTFYEQKVKQSPILKDKFIYKSIEIPTIPFLLTKAEARKKFRIPEDDFVIYAGAQDVNDPRKGLKLLMQSMDYMINNVYGSRKITLLLLGRVSGELKFDKRINVVVPGFMPYKEVYRAFYACDVFASPTVADGGPYMVNYSMACGRPVVAFPIGVALDLIKDGENGFIVPYKDAAAFGDRLVRLYNMPQEHINCMTQKCKEVLDSFRGKGIWYKQILK